MSIQNTEVTTENQQQNLDVSAISNLIESQLSDIAEENCTMFAFQSAAF